MAPVQVRLSGAADDVRRLAEFLAGLQVISASPVDIKARPSGIAQGYMTVNITPEPEPEMEASP
jgi:hypothetical protein